MKKVLLVEDDMFIQEIYMKGFQKADYIVTVAKDGKDALEKAKLDEYDIILLDVMMPEMNGIEVLRIWRAPRSPLINTPVFLLTNLGQDSIIQEAFKIGANGYFLKAQMDVKNIIAELELYFTTNKNQ